MQQKHVALINKSAKFTARQQSKTQTKNISERSMNMESLNMRFEIFFKQSAIKVAKKKTEQGQKGKKKHL